MFKALKISFLISMTIIAASLAISQWAEARPEEAEASEFLSNEKIMSQMVAKDKMFNIDFGELEEDSMNYHSHSVL